VGDEVDFAPHMLDQCILTTQELTQPQTAAAVMTKATAPALPTCVQNRVDESSFHLRSPNNLVYAATPNAVPSPNEYTSTIALTPEELLQAMALIDLKNYKIYPVTENKEHNIYMVCEPLSCRNGDRKRKREKGNCIVPSDLKEQKRVETRDDINWTVSTKYDNEYNASKYLLMGNDESGWADQQLVEKGKPTVEEFSKYMTKSLREIENCKSENEKNELRALQRKFVKGYKNVLKGLQKQALKRHVMSIGAIQFNIPSRSGAPGDGDSRPCLEGYPKIVDENNVAGKVKCLYLSLAHAFASMQDETNTTANLGGLLAQEAEHHNDHEILPWKSLKKSLITFMIKTAPWLVPHNVKEQTLENLMDDEHHGPKVVILQGSDGSRNHAVTIVGKWIFDSNAKSARPLNKEELSFCLGGKVTFVNVVVGIHYKEDRKKLFPIMTGDYLIGN